MAWWFGGGEVARFGGLDVNLCLSASWWLGARWLLICPPESYPHPYCAMVARSRNRANRNLDLNRCNLCLAKL